MANSSANPSSADLVDGTLGVAAGLGIVTMALFPLAIPILALTAVALIPLLVPLVLLPLAWGLIAAPLLLLRRYSPERLSRSQRKENDMTPKTQAPAAARDGFVTYDELGGPDLDAARWSPARLPLPTGGEHIPLDPNAELAVGEGEVRVTIPRFSLSHHSFQSADSPKYLTFSTGRFELPPDRPATFAVDLAVENISGEPGDYRRGMAAFHVFDLDVSKRVFAVCGTSTRVFALHEQLGLRGGGAGEPFYHVVESPYEDFDDDFTRLRACEITLDRSRSAAAWRVDGRTVYEAHATLIPERVRIGFGIWTMLPIRHGRSRSLDGQGMNARWRRFRVRGVDA